MPSTADTPTRVAIAPDIADPQIYLTEGIPHERFAEIRAMPGLAWHPYQNETNPDNGFWVVSRHEDARIVSRTPEVFSSGVGHTNLWDLDADALEARRSLIDCDPPDHTRLRRLTATAFTPKHIKAWEPMVRQLAGELIDNFIAVGGGDWVELVAAPLPIQVILTMLGVPLEDADFLVEISNYLVEGTGVEQSLSPDAFGNTTELRLLPFQSPASHALFEYGAKMRELRRTDPSDDLVTRLVQEQDGDKLSPEEFRNLFHVLVFAGNETTRTAISHGAVAFADYPDQWQRLLDDHSMLDSTVEEVLRWATPVLHMRRTATTDTVFSGTPIARGDKVVMWYASTSFDEAAHRDPLTFDVGREPNPHDAFGSGGPHHCLGAFLARLELNVLFDEMAKRGLALRRTTDVQRTPSNFVHGILSVGMEPA